MKESFIFYTKWIEKIDKLDDTQLATLMRAIFCAQSEKEIPDMDLVTEMCFSFMNEAIEANNMKYQKTCERNRENGKKGGRPKQNMPEEDDEKNRTVISENPKNRTVISENPKNRTVISENPKKPSGYFEKPKKTLYEYDSEYDTDTEYDSDNGSDNEIDNESDFGTLSMSVNRVNYQEIVDLYNDTCVSLPKITHLSESRKKAIKARLRKYKLSDFEKVFVAVESSDFLKGSNDRNWSASFDWILKDSSFAKILDGNYKNKSSPPPGGSSIVDFWRDA